MPGWFARVDAFLFAAIHDSHVVGSVSGDLLEVGVYQGRSAILLGHLQRPGERLVVCDLFGGQGVNEENEAEHRRYYADLSLQTFEQNYRRFHRRLPDEIIIGPSSELVRREEELRKRFRLIHIDGSHEYSVVQSDIRLAQALLVDGGMVIFDDVNSPHTPGVAAAVWGAVMNEGLIPHLVTKKLYASWTEIQPIDLSPLSQDWRWEPHAVGEHTVLHLEERGSPRQRIRDWIPTPLLPTVTSLRHKAVELTRAGRQDHRAGEAAGRPDDRP